MHRLSARAQAVLHAVTAWAHQLPAGTVDVTYTLFPPEDDYGSELLITLQPHTPCGGVLTIGVISDTTYPFHFHLGEMNEIAAAADLTLSRVVPAHLPLFLNHRGEAQARGRGRSLLRGGHRADPTYRSASSRRRCGQLKPGLLFPLVGSSKGCTEATD